MAKRKQQPEAEAEDDNDWRAGLEEDRRRRQGQPDPGPEDIGEKTKALQREPEGSEAKERERTRTDPETGETLLPESVAEQQRQSLERFGKARSGAVEPADEEGLSRAEETGEGLEAQWRDNPAMLGVGRNVPEEPVTLVRAADLPGEGVDPARKYGGQDTDLAKAAEQGGAPVEEPSYGQKHAPGAPWPGPLEHSADAPTPSPEPGPEPSQQWHPPQPIKFRDHEAAVRGTLGPGREEQDAERERLATEAGEPVERAPAAQVAPERPDDGIPRNSAGKVPHTHLAEKAIEALFAAYPEGEMLEHGKMTQALLHAQRLLRAKWHTYREQFRGKKEGGQEAA